MTLNYDLMVHCRGKHNQWFGCDRQPELPDAANELNEVLLLCISVIVLTGIKGRKNSFFEQGTKTSFSFLPFSFIPFPPLPWNGGPGVSAVKKI